MRVVSHTFLLALSMAAFPSLAGAGWVLEMQNTSIRPNGERAASETSTMLIEDGQVRTIQANVSSVMDYKKGLFTLINPLQKYYWSGSVDQYVDESTRNRKEKMRSRAPNAPVSFGKREIDEKKLPAITVTRTDEKKEIAGRTAAKYLIAANGELFQEVWLAEGLDLSADLDPQKFVDYHKRMSAGMIGKTAGPYNALYRSAEYRNLLAKGYPLAVLTHHGGGGFERTTTRIAQREIEAKEFEVGDDFRRVRLSDVLPSQENSSASSR